MFPASFPQVPKPALVQKIKIGVTPGYTAPCNSITFLDLDGNTDEGYSLEIDTVSNVSTTTNMYIFCNNDQTATNYYTEYARSANGSWSTARNNTPLIGIAAPILLLRATIAPNFNFISQWYADMVSSYGFSGICGGYKVTAPANITRIDIVNSDATLIFGVGSIIRLYRRNV